MSALAARTGAINLGQGFPDEDGPPEVLEAARQAIADGVNQYPPGRGIPELRDAIAEHQHRFYGVDVDPDARSWSPPARPRRSPPPCSHSSTPGDEVVTLEPFYDSYGAMIALAGARTSRCRCAPPTSDPTPTTSAPRSRDRTRVILINSPHNPTGTVLGGESSSSSSSSRTATTRSSSPTRSTST